MSETPENPSNPNAPMFTSADIADPFEGRPSELGPYPESAVNLLRHLPDAPRIDVRVRDFEAQALRTFWRTLDTLTKNLANWDGPYMNEHRLFGATADQYVGPLNEDGGVPSPEEYLDSIGKEEFALRLRLSFTPLYVAHTVAQHTVTRERLYPRLIELGRVVPDLQSAALQLIEAMDKDLEDSGQRLPKLREFFCKLGLDSKEWRKEAWELRETWSHALDWTYLSLSPVMRSAHLGDYDLEHIPLYVSEETLVASGMPVGVAKQSLRVLRAAVDEKRVENVEATLIAFAHAHLSSMK